MMMPVDGGSLVSVSYSPSISPSGTTSASTSMSFSTSVSISPSHAIHSDVAEQVVIARDYLSKCNFISDILQQKIRKFVDKVDDLLWDYNE